jgi:Flp pilus assembly protein TadG
MREVGSLLMMKMGTKARAGGAIVYAICVMTALFGLCSFAVDFGRVTLAKSELRAAADSAALAGAKLASSGVTAVQQEVAKLAAANTCDGTAVTLDQNADIDFLNYDSVTRTSTVLTGSARANANAVRVRLLRTTARGNPIKLMLASMVGIKTCDIHAEATAYQSPSYGGYIGISLTRMFNTARFDGYNAMLGGYSVGSAQPGNLLSFKDLWLYDTSSVYGEAHWDLTGSFNHDATAIISPGPVTAQKLKSDYPSVPLGNLATVNNNGQLTLYYTNNQLVIPDNKPAVTYPAGTYYFTKFDIGSGNHVYFTGPTTIYLNCSGDLTSTLAAADFKPSNLSVKVINGNWKIEAGGVFYGSFYNPYGDLHHHNGGISYGSVISDLLCFRQTSQGHQDLSLGKYAVSVGAVLVK